MLRLGLGALLVSVSSMASAHSFGQSYSLPVPFWLYGTASMAALAISFLIAAVFMRRGAAISPRPDGELSQHKTIGLTLKLAQGLSLVFLALSIVTGIWGHPNAYANLNMTLFWIIFVLAFAYLHALVGGVHAATSPWLSLSKLLGKLHLSFTQGLFKYNAQAYGYSPAIVLYMAFIWVELFGETKPFSLAMYLLAYSGINVFGSLLWGSKSWFHYGELFSVFLRMMSLISPLYLAQNQSGEWRLHYRWPFAGLLKQQADHSSLVLFILFMLSSTAYDGLHETVFWLRLFWSSLLPVLDPEVLNLGLRAVITHRNWYHGFQWSGLLLSPFVYLAAYWLALWLGKLLARSDVSLAELSLRFAYSLLPIALVYHITHYYALLMTQGIKVLALFSDPFGLGWNLFGTANWFDEPIIPNVAVVWHVQVVTIVIGHIISVYIAHVEALRLFGDHRRATLSQLPMLLLMMAFTTAGLWILAQPIQTGL